MKAILTLIVLSLVASCASDGTPIDIDKRTKASLEGLQFELQLVTVEAYRTCPTPFIVIDGLRTLEEQKKHVANGASLTLNSRHLTGEAIDFIPASFDWNDIEAFREISECFKSVSPDLIWGGDWTTFRDYGHIEMKS